MNRIHRGSARGVPRWWPGMALWASMVTLILAVTLSGTGCAAEPKTPEFPPPSPLESLTPAVRERLNSEISEATLRPVIEFLASPECEGRFSNTPGNHRAAERLAGWLAELGFEPLGTDGFFQSFPHPGFDPDWPHELDRRLNAFSEETMPANMEPGEKNEDADNSDQPGDGETEEETEKPKSVKTEQIMHRMMGRNIIGVLRGSDPVLADEYIFLVAHYDHMGRTADWTWIGEPIATDDDGEEYCEDDGEYYDESDEKECDIRDVESVNKASDAPTNDSAERAPPEPDEYRPGADDNASGCAANLAIGRFLASLPERPRRSVVVTFVDAEELGLLGSTWLAGHLPIEREKIVFVINSDMLGRVRSNRVVVGGEQSVVGMRAMLRRLNADPAFVAADGERFELLCRGVIGPMSDHWPFMKLRIPGAMFHSMVHPDYHQTTDTVDRINFDDMVPLTRIAAAMVYEIAQQPQRPATPVGFEAEAYIDLAVSDDVLTAFEQEWGFEYALDTSDPNVLVVGDIQPNSPAEQAGLLRKDRILAIRAVSRDEPDGESPDITMPIDFEAWWNAHSVTQPAPATQTMMEDVMDAMEWNVDNDDTTSAEEPGTAIGTEPSPTARQETFEHVVQIERNGRIQPTPITRITRSLAP